MSVDRLLSPNEAKFWLMDHRAPMNTVVVVQTRRRLDAAALLRDSAFTLPSVLVGRHVRPRWSSRGEDARPGVVEQIDGDAMSWLSVATDLLHQRVGGPDSPLWRAVVIRHAEGSTLALATSHALTDWRSCLTVAEAFLAGRHPGALQPACEELLPPEIFGDPDAADLIDGWWTAKAGALWEAAGLDRLAGVMPADSRTMLACERFSAAETAAFLARCKAERATPNGALAAALRDRMAARNVAHAVDMHRFIDPAPPPGPGLAISHIVTDLADPGAVPGFWAAARAARGAVAERLRAGAHGDALLVLPKVLLQRDMTLIGGSADLTITGAPSHDAPADPDTVMRLVLSSARVGDVVLLSTCEGRLQLMSSCPADRPAARPVFDLAAVAERLRAAVTDE